MRKWLIPTLVFFGVAAVTHVATVYAIPRAIMQVAMAKLADEAGGYNRIHRTGLRTDQSRGVVKPSPDLLYSACVFDISESPVVVSGVASERYLSVSGYDSRTDNFFVTGDHELDDGPFRILIKRPRQSVLDPRRFDRVIDAPSDRGNVLFRHLVLSKPQLSLVAAEQAQDDCRPVTAPPAKPGASGEPLKAAGRGRSAAP